MKKVWGVRENVLGRVDETRLPALRKCMFDIAEEPHGIRAPFRYSSNLALAHVNALVGEFDA